MKTLWAMIGDAALLLTACVAVPVPGVVVDSAPLIPGNPPRGFGIRTAS
jgi:hypothetical protein